MKFLLESPQFSPLTLPEVSTNASSADYSGAGTQVVVGQVRQLSDNPKYTASCAPPSSPLSVEMDPLGKPSNAPGAKMDAGKANVYRGAISYFPRALEAIARVSEIGARKYSWKGWESVPDGFIRYTEAMTRHLIKEDVEQYDQDTGCLHAAQTAWNSLARLELKLRENEKNT